MPERRFTDDEVDAALEALSEPERFREAETRVARIAPQLQHILAQALGEGGWFGEAHDREVRKAAALTDEGERTTRVRTLHAEQARIGMLEGVAVGWELDRELETQGD